MGRMLIILVALVMLISSYAFMNMHETNARNSEIVNEKARILECRITAKEVVDSLLRRYLLAGDVDIEESFFTSKGKQVTGKIDLLARNGSRDSIRISATDSSYGEDAEVQINALVVADQEQNQNTGKSPFGEAAEELVNEDGSLHKTAADTCGYFSDSEISSIIGDAYQAPKKKWNAMKFVGVGKAVDFRALLTTNPQEFDNRCNPGSSNYEEQFYDWMQWAIISKSSDSNPEDWIDENFARYVLPWGVVDSLVGTQSNEITAPSGSSRMFSNKWKNFINNELEPRARSLEIAYNNEEAKVDLNADPPTNLLTVQKADSLANMIFWPRFNKSGNNGGGSNQDRVIKKIAWRIYSDPTTPDNRGLVDNNREDENDID